MCYVYHFFKLEYCVGCMLGVYREPKPSVTIEVVAGNESVATVSFSGLA